MIGSEPGPRSSSQARSATEAGSSPNISRAETGSQKRAPHQKQQQKQTPQKKAHSNLRTTSPPSPGMFSYDSMSADEDENITLQTNEWKFPEPVGRNNKAIKKKLFGNPNKEIVIVVCVGIGKYDSEQVCGAFDESFVPVDNAMALVSEWEVLLRRTTIYLCAWAEGIVSPKILRKYIGKENRSWIKLYRYI